jgi:hypothetical protein
VTNLSLLRRLLRLLRPSALTASLASEAADLCHVLSVFAYCNSTFATGLSSLLGCKLVCISAFMCHFATFAGDLALLLGVHSGKSS